MVVEEAAAAMGVGREEEAAAALGRRALLGGWTLEVAEGGAVREKICLVESAGFMGTLQLYFPYISFINPSHN
jgi:hypothetical protein